MDQTVIGVHDGHNAAAAIVRGGILEFVVEEERFTRQKNQNGFPSHAVQACLDHAQVAPSDVAELSFATNRQTPWGQRRPSEEAFKRNKSLAGMVRRQMVWYPTQKYHSTIGVAKRLEAAEQLGFQRTQCRRYDHHFGHAATAYYGMREDATSPYLVVTLDGFGDLSCGTVSVARDGRLERIAQTPFTDSLGTIYSVTTAAMGFAPQEHEYKLMGMAPYAATDRAEKAARAFHSLIRVDEEHLRLRRQTPEPTYLLHRRIARLISGMRFDDICAGLQRMCEETVVTLVRAAIRRTGIRRVLCAGGVFMNVKANKLVMEMPEVDYLGIPPSCGDESLSMGMAWHSYARLAGREAADAIEPLGPVYLGPELDQKEVLATLQDRDFQYSRPDDIDTEVARILAAGHPVARCRGRLEFGARALGNRSILADPAQPDVVRTINRMIKKRDFWMPFAPLVARERSDEYLVNEKQFPSPYMMLSFDTTDKFVDMVAAVHGADLTARAQILEDGHNPGLSQVLKEFESLTGRPVLLNTSFNLHGWPVVLGPKDAMEVFENSGLRYLALGDYLVQKP